MRKEDRQQEWMERLADYRASGLTMRAWCEARQVSFHKLRYWLRATKQQESAPAAASFVPLTVSEAAETGASLVVRVGEARIELEPGFNPQLLRDVVQALKGLAC
ncbi:hypothetical protein SAMN02744102_02225 [Paenibacillus barengoltzii]|uniref:IS66 family insertion sequence element accessory protein TnpA n=1 Tax=Paenibacillus barengoltzii TaxID=343517 RepID=UPI000A0900ED|nr:hypothetical protein [Paenibacillus barengoltzii]SMF25568.1 hypothetical protein SAMN02744102_02225 [Paenibacillus barengoltzii]